MTKLHAVYAETGKPVASGDTITDFRGERWGFMYVTNGPVSFGKIVVSSRAPGYGRDREFFPSAFPALKIVED